MAEDRRPGPIGTRPPSGGLSSFDSTEPTPNGSETPGPLGFDVDPEPLADRSVTRVDCDWKPTPKPNTDPIPVDATDLAELAQKLAALPEAGEGGGRLRAGPVPAGTSAEVTVTLQGNLRNRAVQWNGYDGASPAAKAHWDKVLANLKRHETRHMEIAIEEGDALAQLLIGHKVGSKPTIEDKVSAANDKMKQRQQALDDDSDHGKKQGHPYGDCNIDPSIK